jgi:hypothetical protein
MLRIKGIILVVKKKMIAPTDKKSRVNFILCFPDNITFRVPWVNLSFILRFVSDLNLHSTAFC